MYVSVFVELKRDVTALALNIKSSFFECRQVLKNRISDVKLKVGPDRFNFKKHALDGHNEGRQKTQSSVQLYRVVVITVLLLFSVLFLASCWSILCSPGSSPSS